MAAPGEVPRALQHDVRSYPVNPVTPIVFYGNYPLTARNGATPWGNTKEKHWRAAGRTATFRFTRASYREGFLKACERALRPNVWSEVEEMRSDNDPAQATDRERGRV